jgi:hypothetical protein
MTALQLGAFAFLVGLTLCGLAGSVMELVSGRRLAFAAPYVTPAHVVRSLAMTVAAGPFMLVNDALDAHREQRLSTAGLGSCMCTAVIWLMALGVVTITVASVVASLLSLPVNLPR